MKKNIDKAVPQTDDLSAKKKRREDYALRRDLQALDNNEAIAKRKNLKEKNLAKCEKCGKEFSAETTEGPMICPDCK